MCIVDGLIVAIVDATIGCKTPIGGIGVKAEPKVGFSTAEISKNNPFGAVTDLDDIVGYYGVGGITSYTNGKKSFGAGVDAGLSAGFQGTLSFSVNRDTLPSAVSTAVDSLQDFFE